jgi:hypothetical protein
MIGRTYDISRKMKKKKSHGTSLHRRHVERRCSKGVAEVDPKRISYLYMCPRRRWVDNIKIDLRMGWYGLDLSGSGEGPVEASCEHDNEPGVP